MKETQTNCTKAKRPKYFWNISSRIRNDQRYYMLENFQRMPNVDIKHMYSI